MLERLDETEVDARNIDATSNAVFREVLGHWGYAIGLGHSIIHEPSLSLRNNRDYQHIVEENEENKNDTTLYKKQLEALRADLQEFKN